MARRAAIIIMDQEALQAHLDMERRQESMGVEEREVKEVRWAEMSSGWESAIPGSVLILPKVSGWLWASS